ncbi:3-methylmercaptopropionyl-CoA dehydrogenase (DmdC) [Pseudonocardia sp. Ae168_Ps1]|uniref:acyl-CoA dehydrogenase n=1 Tax=unclassified Pseudonocardia TaxID=2619320 RepID=UPI0001FFE4FC|nr:MULTISPECIES: acyl-CoA dehydrogenase [unclassified Pseudonocardia]ALE75591.1 butyryl-CoA dehydrogenase [Pseudonocardia sp. EC080625-04]OLL74941.1 3-methylmercaptopropionyl-CoA dehydrogenase (DmdC) [Pseudonocardia sp. Ae150A_Ps1]OLL80933.1 3-methylmercaptopropionyl-CoA dehydrogenase (DmdC) [Pseudonocardia sp. Ae168_Ps1]OLL84949.1 3-methylmercaptopropionyl-CoA dehydrogenase (DmdC) [Pseudonocardia sp. Ae263_Ps1]OLL95034.1 3-methylmercaptopropionyl-CoA dehydrogenase (DmdC) [Pseudonocardia sp. A
MGHYKSNVRDLEFNLFEVFRIQDHLGTGPFSDVDVDTAKGVLSELSTVCTGPLAEHYATIDRNPPVYDPKTFSVTTPQELKDAYKVLWDGEWWRLGVPNELGGMGIPPSVQWAAAEMMLGANPAVFMYMAGPNFAGILHKNGNDEQRRWAEIMVERGWGATMVLTEPDAGSDVGAGRTKAVQQDDGTWHIEGVKRFITSAEQDFTENIMHLVLARPEGAKQGTKGLSLFLVPKFHFDTQTGESGERNGAFVTNVEHKMGLKASTTCELTFGAHGTPAVGWLLGDVHDGIAQMFQVIEYARMMVGTKAIGTLSAGYLTALEFAKERVQGADLTQMTDKTAPRVTITHHPDVRRSLMLQKAYAEGMRAVYTYTATFQDRIRLGDEGGGVSTELAEKVNDLLLPIVKGVGSERATEQLVQSLQTLGGSGFLQDYAIEQYIRDAKIDSLYEGTTAIQSQDFLFRKIVRDNGQALAHVAGEVQAFIDSDAGNGRLKEERELLRTALTDVQGMLGSLTGYLYASAEDVKNLYKVGQHTVRLLMAVGDLLVGWLLLRQASVALEALGTDGVSAKDRAFYEGKAGVASFFAKTVLPRLTSDKAIVEGADNALMELDEAAF